MERIQEERLGMISVKGRHIFRIFDQRTHSDEPILSVFQDLGVVPRDSSERRVVAAIKNLETFKLVTPGDFVISLRSFQGGIEQSRIRGIVSPAYTVLRNVNPEYSSDYLRWVLKDAFFISILASRSDSLRDGKAIDPRDVLELEFPKPPLEVQKVIASYLTHKTTQIDTLITKKQRFLTLLEEKRQALITRAVTKGLNPDVPMKDSGVEWIGEVPEHWEQNSLRIAASAIIDYRGATPQKSETGIPLITATNVGAGSLDFSTREEFLDPDTYGVWMKRGFPQRGDLLLTTEAPLGHAALIEEEGVALAQRIILLRPDPDRLNSRYFLYFFLGDSGQGQLYSMATGSTALGIKASWLRTLQVLVPPLSEQEEIVRLIEDRTGKNELIKDRVMRAITTLREYRSALITNAATGRIDLSDWRAEDEIPAENEVSM